MVKDRLPLKFYIIVPAIVVVVANYMVTQTPVTWYDATVATGLVAIVGIIVALVAAVYGGENDAT